MKELTVAARRGVHRKAPNIASTQGNNAPSVPMSNDCTTNLGLQLYEERLHWGLGKINSPSEGSRRRLRSQEAERLITPALQRSAIQA